MTQVQIRGEALGAGEGDAPVLVQRDPLRQFMGLTVHLTWSTVPSGAPQGDRVSLFARAVSLCGQVTWKYMPNCLLERDI